MTYYTWNGKRPNNTSKLTLAKARDIRVKKRDGATVRELAIFYRVSIGTIYKIIKHEAWKENQ